MAARNELGLFMLLIAVLLIYHLMFSTGALFEFQDSFDTITGRNVLTQVNVSLYTVTTCTYTLPQGLSLWSIYCIGTQDNTTDIVAYIPGMKSIFTYNPNGGTDKWQSYNPSLPSWTVQDLNRMTKKAGYYIYMNYEREFSYEGSAASETSISLYQGWNLIGYPSDDVRNVNATFGSIFGTYNLIETYNSTTAEWQAFDPMGSNNTLNRTYPWQGYWINVTSPTTLGISG